MSAARSSYLKTIYLAMAGLVVALLVASAIAAFDFPFRIPLLIAAVFGSTALASVVVAGGVVLHRETRLRDGRPDLFLTLNRWRSESALSRMGLSRAFAGNALFRLLPPYGFKVGDLVEIRSWEEIEKTLDEKGALEGIPFMREMLPFCGRRARILRNVDKVYDYGKTKTLRRTKDCVLLVDIRCDGAAHGGCQARCSIFWKTAWLKRVKAGGVLEAVTRAEREAVMPAVASAHPALQPQSDHYVCQYTEVQPASKPMSKSDIRQDFRPLFSGNVSLPAFFIAILTWEFNRVQQLRGGIPFPAMSNSGQAKTPPSEPKNISAGTTARILSVAEIGKTLDVTSRNRGLWFDREMTKHCNQPYRVLNRVDRIIDDATNKMVPMKTPCLILDDVVASGEFLHFLGQQEYLFWREAWLDGERNAAESDSDAAKQVGR